MDVLTKRTAGTSVTSAGWRTMALLTWADLEARKVTQGAPRTRKLLHCPQAAREMPGPGKYLQLHCTVPHVLLSMIASIGGAVHDKTGCHLQLQTTKNVPDTHNHD